MDEGSLPVLKPSEISSVPSGSPAVVGTAGPALETLKCFNGRA